MDEVRPEQKAARAKVDGLMMVLENKPKPLVKGLTPGPTGFLDYRGRPCRLRQGIWERCYPAVRGIRTSRILLFSEHPINLYPVLVELRLFHREQSVMLPGAAVVGVVIAYLLSSLKA